jgi:hypothetical protein
MEGTYLLDLYKSLSAGERDAFALFVNAALPPGQKSAGKIKALIQFMQKAVEKGVQLEKQPAYELLFPGDSVKEGKLEKIMAAANQLLKTFLLQQQYFSQQNEPGRQIDWVNILKERGLDSWRQKSLQKLRKVRQLKALHDLEYYHTQFRVDFAAYQNEAAHNQLKGDLHVPDALQSLDLYYHFARLELTNHYLLQQKVTNLDADTPGILPVAQPIPPSCLLASPVLLIAHKISDLLRQDLPPLADFQELSQLLQTYESSISPELLQQFYTYLRNFCAFLINAGAQDLLPLFHQLQRDNLARGYLYHEGGRISASAYLSVTTGALRAGNAVWAHDFVENHLGRIIGDNASHDLYRLNKALCLFAAGRYEAALDHIAPVFEFLNYTLLAKRLEIKILYELESDLLPYKAGAFKIFITRASQKFMPHQLRRPNADFINVIHQILRSKPGQAARSERLLRRIQAKPHIAERDWLMEKIALLR